MTLEKLYLSLDVGLWNQLIFHSKLQKMSIRECLCDKQTRDAMARGVAQSVNVVGMDLDGYEGLCKFAENGTAAEKNYLWVIFFRKLTSVW